MDRVTFNNAILSEGELNAMSIDSLRLLVEQFPYFQTARILLLKKLKDEDNIAFDRELKKSAVCIWDRAKLYVYLNAFVKGGERSALPELSLITTSGRKVDNVSASYSSEADTTFNYLFLSEEENTDSSDYAKTESEEVLGSANSDKILESEWSLIEQFTNLENVRIKPPRDQSQVPQGNLAAGSIVENNSILTETLAKIYVKQKKYDKAISIFRSLSLKFPDKNAYFAAQIEELDILLKNS